MSPEVSIIIPTNNRRVLLQKTIDSVLSQTFPDYEIIVVDDGSTDGTGDALLSRYADRITYMWQENQGEACARNRGIAKSSGRYVALLDSDDLWVPEKLALQLERVQKDPSVGVACSQAWVIDAVGNRRNALPLGHDYSVRDFQFERLCLRNRVINSTALLRRDAFETAGGYDPHIQFGEDWDLWLRIARTYRIDFVSLPLASFRVHGGGQSQRNSEFEAQLHDHLYLIHKSFEQRVLDTEPVALRDLAIAWRYVNAFVAAGAVGQTVSATDYLRQAINHAPALYNEPEFAEAILAGASSFVANAESPDYEKAGEFLERALAVTSSLNALPTALRRQIMTETYLMLAYVGRKHSNPAICRHFYRKAIRTNPAVMARRGVLAGLMDPSGARFGGLRQLQGNEQETG